MIVYFTIHGDITAPVLVLKTAGQNCTADQQHFDALGCCTTSCTTNPQEVETVEFGLDSATDVNACCNALSLLWLMMRLYILNVTSCIICLYSQRWSKACLRLYPCCWCCYYGNFCSAYRIWLWFIKSFKYMYIHDRQLLANQRN